MKMRDVFELPITRDIKQLFETNQGLLCRFDLVSEAEAAAHAINTHDQLVEALDTIIAVMDNIQDSEGLNVKEIYTLLEVKETLKQAKEGGQ